jgi:hypothetical protein
MNFVNFKTIVFGSVTAYALIMTGCGGSGGGSSSSTSGGTSGSTSGGTDTTAPVITSSQTATVVENTPLNHTVTADDANTITYSIAGGADEASFSINQVTGVLSFTAPAVNNTPVIYRVTVRAEDASSNKSDQDITVTVTEAGAITNRAIMPLIPISFTRDDTKDVVVNSLTGFIWEDTSANEDNKTFAQAQAHCENLKTTNFAGINNWRLPTRSDLFKMARYTPNAVDGSYVADGFKNKKGEPYWTSEEVDATTAWAVTFGGIGDIKVAKNFLNDENNVSSAYVRCVSGFHQPATFTNTDRDPERTDVNTGLTWKTHSSEANGDYPQGNFATAQATCTAYGNGYRLPNINELRSIVEYDASKVVDIKGKANAKIIGSVFGDFTITEADGDVYDVKTFEGGFDTLVWSSTRNSDGKVRTLYISPINPSSGATGEISDLPVEDNATVAPRTPDPIRTVCVKSN